MNIPKSDKYLIPVFLLVKIVTPRRRSLKRRSSEPGNVGEWLKCTCRLRSDYFHSFSLDDAFTERYKAFDCLGSEPFKKQLNKKK